ncbi:putative dsRNA-binding protein [Deinococcus puniceus]|uniref:Double-stranded RNA-binding protein n=1 Tax=Deinococcus puniceus TaxID=1182568 RepID=A0A172TBI4_9DEIO|nr:putative dsRNA-binding protein [Deinococcus puniceus]ANE44370.1 double-stranded RNA-binding protein [Deinococcus puniceus]
MTSSTPPTPPGAHQANANQANPKGDLIARLITLGAGAPTFQVSSDGPAHERTFRVRVLVGGRELGEGGESRSKKDAERLASEAALRVLDGRQEAGNGPEVSGPEAERDEDAQGQWPIYAAVLAEALDVALDLADEDASVDDVRREAGRLYRDLLADLGHGPE